ncbi:MAG: hypothetical protein R3F56_25615 [Planctomycetota bacterium]
MKTISHSLAAHVAAAAVFASIATAQTILTVPQTFPTIGAAIAAAPSQPQPVVIEVMPGDYLESLSITLDGLVVRRAPGATQDVRILPPLGSFGVEFTGVSRATRVEDLVFKGQSGNIVSLVQVSGASPTILRCRIADNEAPFGAGITVNPTFPISNIVGPLFVDCDVENNTADIDGGGAEVAWTTRFENCRFTGNTAVAHGAGMFVSFFSQSPTFYVDVVDSVFADNGLGLTPQEGGAFYVQDAIPATRWFDCRLQNNRAEFGGGGVSRGRGLQMDYCVVIANTATQTLGGGLVIETGFDQNGVEQHTTGVLTSTKLIENVAQTGAGGLLIRRGGTDPVGQALAELYMVDDLVANNAVLSGQGGGMLVDAANVVAVKTTVTANSATGASGRGVWVAASTSFVGFDTSILWSNAGSVQRNQIAGVAGAGIVVQYSDLQGLIAGAFPGASNINLVPQFINIFGVPENSYFLQASSPCVNTGNPAVALDGSESTQSSLTPDSGVADMGFHRNALPVAPINL